MEQQNDMLSALLSDPEKLQSAIKMASSILGGGAGSTPPPSAVPGGDMPPEQPYQNPDPVGGSSDFPPSASAEASGGFSPPRPMETPPAAPVGGFGNFMPPPQGSSQNNNNYDPSAEFLSKAMPILNAIARSSANSVNHDKVNLLNSVKPFVATNITGQLDHAMRLVSMARMARSVMGQLTGSLGGDDGTLEL